MTKTQTPELQLVSGETGHKYFHQMLNMADDDLNPHEYRLLGHYLRWAGHGGTREEGIRQTAKVCHMGQKALRKHRAALVTKGYLRLIEPTAEQLKEGEPTKIIVLDRWAENIARYAQTDTPPVSKQIQGSPEPVSKQIHPPVSKQIHKEELSLEEQKSEEPIVDFPSHMVAFEQRNNGRTHKWVQKYSDLIGHKNRVHANKREMDLLLERERQYTEAQFIECAVEKLRTKPGCKLLFILEDMPNILAAKVPPKSEYHTMSPAVTPADTGPVFKGKELDEYMQRVVKDEYGHEVKIVGEGKSA